MGARLSGGEASGRRLLTEASGDLRASTGLLRSACFNILGERVVGSSVLDLFAGVGTLGLEALSRGAAQVNFVEVSRRRGELIRANLELLGWSDRALVVVADAVAWLQRTPPALYQAGLVLLDPPYRERGPELLSSALRLLGDAALAQPGWDPVLAVEHHRQLQVPQAVGALHCARSSRYGTSALSFYRRQT